MDSKRRISSYILDESLNEKPQRLIQVLKEAVTDYIACTIAGTETKVAKISKQFALEHWGSGNSSIILEKEKLSAPGAAFVNATMANALDLDDGHRLTKGHPGAIIIPAIFSAAEQYQCSGKQFLESLLVGYEVGIRAGIITHQLRPEYHSTGSWGALGAAAGVSRLIGLSEEEIEYALGIAECHSTYSPMMRGIDHPAMTKDGIGWGSMTGISSAYLAKRQFTGIPSLFTEQTSNEVVQDLGNIYRLEQLYFKPYACCRWAQPAVEALNKVMKQTSIPIDSIRKVTIYTFTESDRLLKEQPRNTEEAQYNLLFPFASFLVFQEIGPRQVIHELLNREVLAAMDKIEVVVEPMYDREFPAKALSKIEIITHSGEVIKSPIMQAKGDYDYPLTQTEKKEKFSSLTVPIIGKKKSLSILNAISQMESFDNIRDFTKLLITEEVNKS